MQRSCLLIVLATFGLIGCVSAPTMRVVDLSPPKSSTHHIPEELLLNVGVMVLDANIPETYDERTALNITEEIRRAEANYIAHFAKELLQSTGNWGAVRVIPRDTYAVDIVISGTILHSDGERLIVNLEVKDARGVVWFAEEIETLASKFAYDPEIPEDIDPFQTLYKTVADRMFEYSSNLTKDDINEIRTTAELLFAQDFSPDAFENHVVKHQDDTVSVARIPAEDDPMLARVRKVREREYLFIDTLDEYYGNFANQMYPSYQQWREGSYEDALAYREEVERAKTKMLASGLMLASGVAMQRSSNNVTEYAGYASVIGGAGEALGAIQARANLTLHGAALREMGVSAGATIAPHTIELENATISLMGTVDEQYVELKRVLRRLFFEDYQLPLPEDLTDPLDDEVASTELLNSLESRE